MKKTLALIAVLLGSFASSFGQTSGLPSSVAYGGSSTGSVNVLAVTQAGAQLQVGQKVTFLPNLANTTTTPTLTVNGTTAKTITKYGQLALLAGDLSTSAIAYVIYDGTDWELLNPQTFSAAAALGIAQGGTGQTTASAAFNALSPITTLGDIIYGSASNTSSRLAGVTAATMSVLSQTGTGSVSAAPVWVTAPAISGANITSLNGSAVATGIVPLANGGWGANFAAHVFLGNPTASTASPVASLLGASDVSPPSYVAAAGAVNVLTASYTPSVPALVAGLQVTFLPNLANTTSNPTLNVNGLGAKTITKFGTSALSVSDLTTTAYATVIYDGTEWQLQNPATLASAGAGTPTIVASEEVVASSATPTFSIAFRESVNILTANVTSFTLSAGASGQEKTLTFCQNATGGFTVVPPSNVHGFMTVGSVLSKCSSQHFTYNANQTSWIADSPGVINE